MLKERLKTRKLHSKRIEIQVIECILLILLFILSYDIAWLFTYHNFFPILIVNEHLLHVLIFILVIIILSFYKYFNFLDQPYTEAVKRIIMTCFTLNTCLIMMLYFTKMQLFIDYFITAYVMQIIFMVALKFGAGLLKKNIVKNTVSLVIEKDSSTNGILEAIKEKSAGKLMTASYDTINLQDYVEQADNIYLTGSYTRDLRNKVLSFCTMEDKRIYIVPEIFEIAIRNSTITYVGDTPVFSMDSFRLTEAQQFVKRTADIILSILGIVAALPLFLIVPIAIKCEDRGPIFYRQERSGLNGKPFHVIKFRSMVVDAEKDTGAVLAAENDCRITKIGSAIRSARIDEIPQFFNVLGGSMSLVGPRPERPVFVDRYSKEYPEYHYRLTVKPGITGLAQVKGNYITTAENKIKFDLMYIINYSLFLDIKILFQTVKVVLIRKQAKGLTSPDCSEYLEVVPEKSTLKRKLMKMNKLNNQGFKQEAK